MDALLPLVFAIELFLVWLFVRMAFDIRGIRQMLENQGLFRGVACGWCRMPVPEGADTCGHLRSRPDARTASGPTRRHIRMRAFAPGRPAGRAR